MISGHSLKALNSWKHGAVVSRVERKKAHGLLRTGVDHWRHRLAARGYRQWEFITSDRQHVLRLLRRGASALISKQSTRAMNSWICLLYTSPSPRD